MVSFHVQQYFLWFGIFQFVNSCFVLWVFVSFVPVNINSIIFSLFPLVSSVSC